jgi:hypothetical protein
MTRTSFRARSLGVIGLAAAVVALSACGGGGGRSASAGPAPSTSSPSAPAAEGGGGGRPAGLQFAQMAQAFTQCLRDHGLEVGDLPTGPPNGGGEGRQGGPPADGSRPRFGGRRPADGSVPPAGGEGAQRPQRDPAQLAQRFAARLGLDTTDAAVAAAVDACSSRLG